MQDMQEAMRNRQLVAFNELQAAQGGGTGGSESSESSGSDGGDNESSDGD
jgi:hypothetical protein